MPMAMAASVFPSSSIGPTVHSGLQIRSRCNSCFYHTFRHISASFFSPNLLDFDMVDNLTAQPCRTCQTLFKTLRLTICLYLPTSGYYTAEKEPSKVCDKGLEPSNFNAWIPYLQPRSRRGLASRTSRGCGARRLPDPS